MMTEQKSLRERVAEDLHVLRLTKIGPCGDAYDMPWEFERTTKYGESIYEQADTAIATVFEALLSDEVLDAMTHRVDWPMMAPSDGVIGPRMMNRARIKAAMAALAEDDAQTAQKENHNE